MSIYNTEKVQLPQVKVSEWQKSRLYGFLGIFNRKYANFVRDVSDAIIKWRSSEGHFTYNEHVKHATRHVAKEYIRRDYIFYKMQQKKERISIAEQIGLYKFPTKKIERLPKVTLSKWQADNLYHFLALFGRNYADFIRMLCDNVVIDCLEAQGAVPEFSESNERAFNRVFDDIVEMDKIRGRKQIQRPWPADYSNRQAVVANKK